jgi:hypothetical protein
MKKYLSLCAMGTALMLAACGGGGSGGSGSAGSGSGSYSAISISIDKPSNSVSNAGTTLAVSASANTANTIIKSMAWSVSPAGATLTNANCAAGAKNNQVFTANAQNATGSSQWSCAVGVQTPSTASADTAYTLTLTVVDDKGNTQSAAQPVSFAPAPSTAGPTPPLVSNAGLDFSAATGSKNDIHCDATGGVAPYSYQWVISGNGGYNLTLASYSGADTSFTAPAVTGQAVISVTCRATDSLQKTASAAVNATITPPSATAGKALVANILQPAVALPGSTIVLDGSATGWFDTSGKSTTGPTPVYLWTSTDPAIVISNPTASKTSVTFSTSYKAAANVSFTLKTSSDAISSSSSVNVLVDPYGPFNLTVAPSAIVTKGNTAISITATAKSGISSPQLYYQWTQITGPSVALGGSTTPTLGVVPPVVAAGTTAQYVFRVAVGYAPITTSYTGSYFADATVTVTTDSVVVNNTLIAKIMPPPAATPGATISLDGSETGWVDATGGVSPGPAISYAWTSTDAGVVISNPTAAKTNVTFPTTYKAATNVSFTLKATSGTSTSSSSVNVLVDPFAPFSLAVNPSATVTTGNKAVFITAEAKSGATSPQLYYQWTQVSGPSITLGGANTATLGVTPPAVAAGSTAQYVFRVAVGYSPISSTYTGAYFADATVTVNP